MKQTNELYQDFCDKTKMTFYVNIVVIILIFLFILGNFNVFFSTITKIIIIILFVFSLYITINSSFTIFNNTENILDISYLEQIKNNIILNVIYCIIIFFFIIYFLRDLI